MQSTRSQKARIQWLKSADGVIMLKSFGDWTIDALRDAAGMLKHFSMASRNVSIQWDVSDVGRVDSAGMMLFIHYYDLLKSNKCSIEVIGAKREHEKMYQLLRKYAPGGNLRAFWRQRVRKINFTQNNNRGNIAC